MTQKELSELTDQELLAEAKKRRSASILHAFIIGFMVAIVVYSVAKNTWGLVTLIPLYFVYKGIKKPDTTPELDTLLKERNLK